MYIVRWFITLLYVREDVNSWMRKREHSFPMNNDDTTVVYVQL